MKKRMVCLFYRREENQEFSFPDRLSLRYFGFISNLRLAKGIYVKVLTILSYYDGFQIYSICFEIETFAYVM